MRHEGVDHLGTVHTVLQYVLHVEESNNAVREFLLLPRGGRCRAVPSG